MAGRKKVGRSKKSKKSEIFGIGCMICKKWREVPNRMEYRKLRDGFFCSKIRGLSCKDPNVFAQKYLGIKQTMDWPSDDDEEEEVSSICD
ncbi:methyl-CpG-binding domain-containing protein 1-like [Impatiens glandulifera]|uniref:methyl-CpG-binding domain-containing protein 1-like n=1 Tax=Impatiens glandulifera TaxID=253017 RepID=UPI001FB1327D|nr:methyl-CpG-binding domain-containing protein 1-like [Impatiens glandulifera]